MGSLFSRPKDPVQPDPPKPRDEEDVGKAIRDNLKKRSKGRSQFMSDLFVPEATRGQGISSPGRDLL